MICKAKTHYRETAHSPTGRETQDHSEKCTMGVTTARKTNLKCNWTAAAADSYVGCRDTERETETDLFTGVATRCSSMYKTYSGNCGPELATIARGIQHSAPPPSEAPMRNFLASSCRDPQTSFSPSSPSTFNASTVEAPALSLSNNFLSW
jgi:hypothetical protein